MKVPSGGDCGVTQGWAGLGPAGAHPRPAFWVTWVTLNVDALHNTVGTATLYGSTLAMAPGEAWTTMGRSPPSPPPPPISNGGHSHFLHTLCTFVYRIYNVMSISTSIDWCSHTPCHSAWLAESDPFPHPAEGVRRANVSYVDQVTAQPLALLSSQKAPSSSFARPRPY